jgi:shikimate dehydrogenase
MHHPLLSGDTNIIPIVGHPIAQVKSPAGLSRLFSERGVNSLVIPADVSPDHLQTFLAAVSITRNVPGLIATVPHKRALAKFCDRLTDRARYAGSANVMFRSETGWVGDNTDGLGHCHGIIAAGGTIRNKHVLLIGAGGAGSAMAYEFLNMGCLSLAIHDIEAVRRDHLIARLDQKFPGRVHVGSTDAGGFDLVSNATPLGMSGQDDFPVNPDTLSTGQFVAEVVTKPVMTPLLKCALELGCDIMTGDQMFEAQSDILIQVLGGSLPEDS